MNPSVRTLSALVLLALLGGANLMAGPAYTDPAEAGPDFQLQGEYLGKVQGEEGEKAIAVQVIALGKGRFRAVGFMGGLPGAGADGKEREAVEAEWGDDGTVTFRGTYADAQTAAGKMRLLSKEGKEIGALEKVERKSPTLGAKPPEGAVVLFDGTGVDAFPGGKMTEDGLLMQGVTSKEKFGSHKLHVEFLLPFMPEDRGQARGNSGLYLQGRYEVQMLDSFGLEGKDNECGGIYTVKAPDVNMCLPPLAWQTYDIEFTAAKFDQAGQLVAAPRLTVLHNGVKIHDNVELPGAEPTRAAPVKKGPEPGPVYLQNHGNPVRYRNIWVVPTE